MSSKKKQYGAQFKAKVALEAIRGEKTGSVLNLWIRQVAMNRLTAF
jgi:hypothetical protein